MAECLFHPLIDAYYDHELDAVAADRIEQHLEGCLECTEALASLRLLSSQIGEGSATLADIRPLEIERLKGAVLQAVREDDNQSIPLVRTAGLLGALAASVLIVCGVWLLDLHPASGTLVALGKQKTQQVAPEWERVAMTLHADPRPGIVEDSPFTALRSCHRLDAQRAGSIGETDMGKAKLILILLFALAISAGVVAGMLVSRLPMSASAATEVGPQTPLAGELGLSKEQNAKMRDIWEGVRDKVDDCFVRAQEVQKRRDAALIGLLTDDQKSKFAKAQQDCADSLAGLKGDRDAAFDDAVKKTEQILSAPQKQRYREILQTRLGRAVGSAPDWINPSPSEVTR